MSFLNFDITHFPKDVRHFAEKAKGITTTIKADLAKGIVQDAAAYIPQGEVLREELIAICNAAIAGCDALIKISDGAGLNGRLQRLGADIVKIQHASKEEKHNFGFYCHCFQLAFDGVFGK